MGKKLPLNVIPDVLVICLSSAVSGTENLDVPFSLTVYLLINTKGKGVWSIFIISSAGIL